MNDRIKSKAAAKSEKAPPAPKAPKAEKVGNGVEVTATSNGFYGGARIRAGQSFRVPTGYSGDWFARTDGKPLSVGDLEGKSTEGVAVVGTAAEFDEVERLKGNPEENDVLNGRGEKIGEIADGLEDKAKGEGLGNV